MRVKTGFMLREVAEQWIVVPLGHRVVEFNGIMSLSECGALLWKHMEKKESTEDDLVKSILSEYDIDEATARADVSEFITSIRERGLLE